MRRPRLRATTTDADLALVASTVHSLAVLLSAGVEPVAAWGYLPRGDIPARVSVAVASGKSVPAALLTVVAASTADPTKMHRRGGWRGPPRRRRNRPQLLEPDARSLGTGVEPDARSLGTRVEPDARSLGIAEAEAWRGLAAAWAVATDAGAPLAPTLRSLAVSLRELAQAQRDIRVALAAPAATARMVMVLPVVGVLFGMALGFDTLATLTTTPLGLACLAVGSVLLLVANRWNRRLIRGAQPRQLTPGLEYDLTAIAVSGGAALERARAAVDNAVQRFDLTRDAAEGVESVLALSQRAGVPAAELLRGEAEEVRRRARSEVSERAAALSVTLLLPLGVCVLPAFMAVGVLPLVITIVTSSVVTV
jgi:tight adherence protein B